MYDKTICNCDQALAAEAEVRRLRRVLARIAERTANGVRKAGLPPGSDAARLADAHEAAVQALGGLPTSARKAA